MADSSRIQILDAGGREVRGWSVATKRGWDRFELSHDGGRLFGVARDDDKGATLIAWDINTGVLWEHRGLHDMGATSLAPDGARIAYPLANGIRVVDAATGTDVGSPGLWGLDGSAISLDGTRVATLSMGFVTFWDARRCTIAGSVRHTSSQGGFRGTIEFIASSHDVLVTEHDDVYVRVSAAGKVQSGRLGQIHHNDSQAFTRDGKILAIGVQDRDDTAQIALWDLDQMREVRRVPWPGQRTIETLTYTPDQRTLIATSPTRLPGGDRLRVVAELDAATWATTATYTMPLDSQFTRNLLFGNGDMFALNEYVMQRSTRKLAAKLDAPTAFVSSDGRLALIVRDARRYHVWRLDAPHPRRTASRSSAPTTCSAPPSTAPSSPAASASSVISTRHHDRAEVMRELGRVRGRVYACSFSAIWVSSG